MFPDGDRNSPPVAVCIGTKGVGTPEIVVGVGEPVVVVAGAVDDVVDEAVVVVAVPGPPVHAARSTAAPSTRAPQVLRAGNRERTVALPGTR